MQVRVDVDTQLAEAIRRLPAVLTKQLRPALLRSAGTAARAMRRGAAKAHTTLTNSITSRLTGPLSAEAVVGARHGVYVDQGTGPGGMPPAQSLLDWMKVVGIATGDEKEDNRSVFLIQRRIFWEGTPAQPFVEPAREQTESEIHNRLNNAVGRAIRDAGIDG